MKSGNMRIVKTFEQYKNTNEYSMSPIKINLDDDSSKLKRSRKYSWLGVEFVPKLNIAMKSYHTIVSKPGITGKGIDEPFSIVVYAKTLELLKKELIYRIPLYIEDVLGQNLEDIKVRSEVSDMEKSLGIKYKEQL
jgi:hypothetical protein